MSLLVLKVSCFISKIKEAHTGGEPLTPSFIVHVECKVLGGK